MSIELEFEGNSVAEAIAKACSKLNTSQEELTIEVLTTGHGGIFGLCRKKARIKATVKNGKVPATPLAKTEKAPAKKGGGGRQKAATDKNREKRPAKTVENLPVEKAATEEMREPDETAKNTEATVMVITPEILAQIKNDLQQMITLMGFAYEVILSTEENKVTVEIVGASVEDIIGPEGQTLDAIQYLLRKMFNKQMEEKIMFTVDAGGFRATRLKEIQEMARELAVKVQTTGKTMMIPALNPAERRSIHMILQDNKEIRARSVGDGFYKKIMIYPPGKGIKRPPRKRRSENPKEQ